MAVTGVEYYKVLVLKIDVWESSIIDERHFGTKDQAQAFADGIVENGCMGVVVGM